MKDVRVSAAMLITCLYIFISLCLEGKDFVSSMSNVALCRDVIMSSTFDTEHEGNLAVEGTQSSLWDTCASTLEEENPWLLIDLGNSYTIASVFIYKRDCCPTRLRNLRFEFGPSQDDLTLIHQHDAIISTNTSFEINSDHVGRFLRIWMAATDYLTLCEVEVYGEIVPDTVIDGGLTCWGDWSACSQTCGTGYKTRSRSCTYPSPSNGGADCEGDLFETSACINEVCSDAVNIAFGKTVTMSSIYSLGGGDASNAVNGITTGIWDDGSCASTASEQSPWMTVDLGDVYTVSAVVIINRLDSYTERLNHVHIELGSSLDSLTEVYYQTEAVGEILNVALDGSSAGRYLKIWIDTNDYLTICEIEVYAEEISVYISTTSQPATTASLPQYLGDSCTDTSECTNAISGSAKCTRSVCTCSEGFTAYKNFACLQNMCPRRADVNVSVFISIVTLLFSSGQYKKG